MVLCVPAVESKSKTLLCSEIRRHRVRVPDRSASHDGTSHLDVCAQSDGLSKSTIGAALEEKTVFGTSGRISSGRRRGS